MNRYVTGSDAVGCRWATTTPRTCRSTRTCTAGAPHYVIADHFFQAAFGGSLPEPPVPLAAAAAAVEHGSGQRAQRHRLAPGYRATTRSTAPRSPGADKHGDPGLRPADHPGRTGLRQLERQHPPLPAHAAHRCRPGPKIPLIDDTVTSTSVTGSATPASTGPGTSAAGTMLLGMSTGRGYSNGSGTDLRRPRAPLLLGPTRRVSTRATRTVPNKSFQQHHQPIRATSARYAPGTTGPAAAPEGREGLPSEAATPGNLPKPGFTSRSARRTKPRATLASRNGSDHLVSPLRAIRAAGTTNPWSS